MDSRVFIIGRDPVPQYVRLAPGERLNWTLVFLPEHSGGAAGTAVNAVGFADPTASGPPSYVAEGGTGFRGDCRRECTGHYPAGD